MKILQLIPYFLPYAGGQERYVYNLSRWLVEMGHSVTVLTSNYPPVAKSIDTIDGIRVIRHPTWWRPLRNPVSPGLFLGTDDISEYDVIHTHNEHSTAALAALVHHLRYDVPLVLTCHGQLTFGDPGRDAIERLYMRSVARLILSRCDRIVVNSEDDRSFMVNLDPRLSRQIAVVHNAIDPRFFDGIGEDGPVQSSSFTILYVGRLIRRKGLEWLIRALALIHSGDPAREFRCRLVGEGEDRRFFESLVAEHGLTDIVEFTGAVSPTDLVRSYRHADLFVLPSLSEVCPTVVLEAMYCGLPVVTTDIPGIGDHFRTYAVLVPPRREEALADAITHLMNNASVRRELAQRGRGLVASKYLWSSISKKYESIYREVVDS